MPESSAAPEIEPPETRLARHAGMLRRLQDCAMEMAEIVTSQARAAAQAGELDSGPAPLALARAGKMVRQTIALEDQLHRTFEDRMRAGAPPEDTEIDDAFVNKTRRRMWLIYGRDKVQADVEKAIAHANLPPSETERLLADLNEMLEDENEIAELMLLGPGGVFIGVCAVLGVDIDWDLWRDQLWAQETADYETRQRWHTEDAARGHSP